MTSHFILLKNQLILVYGFFLKYNAKPNLLIHFEFISMLQPMFNEVFKSFRLAPGLLTTIGGAPLEVNKAQWILSSLMITLYCTVLNCTLLQCTTLHYTALNYTILLYSTLLLCTVLFCLPSPCVEWQPIPCHNRGGDSQSRRRSRKRSRRRRSKSRGMRKSSRAEEWQGGRKGAREGAGAAAKTATEGSEL